ncbi:MAG: BMP family protein [Anaerolineae bacterium]
MNKRLSVVMILVIMLAALAMSGCGAAPKATPAATTPTKAAILLEGPLADTGWNTSSWDAMQALSKKYGWEVAYTDNVKTEDMEDLMRGYGQKGYSLVFGPGWLFGDPMVKVSKEFPKTRWVNLNLNTTAGDNFSSNGWVTGEMAYFVGRVAGAMTKSGKLAWIAGTESPLVAYDFDSYSKGAKEVNPNVTLNISYVGNWQDPAKAKELAQAQIEGGADIILSIAGSGDLGVFEAIEAAQKKGTNIQLIGWTGDDCQFEPKYTLVSVVQLPGFLLRIAGEEYQAGKLKSGHSVYGVKDDAQHIAWCGKNVPDNIQQEIDKMLKDYIDGKMPDVPHRTDL